MAKTKTARRRRQYNYNANRRKMWKKKKRLPNIDCEPIKNAWDNRKSVKENMKSMGLSADPNQTLKIKSAKERLAPVSTEDIMETEYFPTTSEKPHVVEELQAIADMPTKKRERISQPMVDYCIYMMEKYGDDYKAMARDIKNYYQDTPKQIRKKISWFKSCKLQYKQYLAKKAGKDNLDESGDAIMS